MITNRVEHIHTAQHQRQMLVRAGFFPLVRIGNAEHFVRRGRRVVLHWTGELPGSSPRGKLITFRETL